MGLDQSDSVPDYSLVIMTGFIGVQIVEFAFENRKRI